MEKYRNIIIKLAVFVAFVAFICLASYLWDKNENAYDAKLERLQEERQEQVPPYCYTDTPPLAEEKK